MRRCKHGIHLLECSDADHAVRFLCSSWVAVPCFSAMHVKSVGGTLDRDLSPIEMLEHGGSCPMMQSQGLQPHGQQITREEKMKVTMPRYSSVRELKTVRDWFRDHPKGTVRIADVWPEQIYDQDQWKCWFIDCLNKKINRKGVLNGRKDDPDWQIEMKRAARQINHPRLIIDWLPRDLMKRFAHRLRGEDQK
jgi:hypothetical protein